MRAVAAGSGGTFGAQVSDPRRTPEPTEPNNRWAVGGIVAMLVGFAVTLVVTSWVSYTRADEVGGVLARGEGASGASDGSKREAGSDCRALSTLRVANALCALTFAPPVTRINGLCKRAKLK